MYKGIWRRVGLTAVGRNIGDMVGARSDRLISTPVIALATLDIVMSDTAHP